MTDKRKAQAWHGVFSEYRTVMQLIGMRFTTGNTSFC